MTSSTYWTPDEGRASPVDVTMSLAKGARQRGVRIIRGHRGHRLRPRPRAGWSASAPRAATSSAKVVLGRAGCGVANWRAKAGVTVPLQARGAHYLLTEPIAGVTPESWPVIEDRAGLRLLPRGGRRPAGRDVRGRSRAWALDAARRRGRARSPCSAPDWGRLAPFLRGRDAALPGARGRRDPRASLLRAGEASPTTCRRCSRRVARGGQPLPRLRPELGRHPSRAAAWAT